MKEKETRERDRRVGKLFSKGGSSVVKKERREREEEEEKRDEEEDGKEKRVRFSVEKERVAIGEKGERRRREKKSRRDDNWEERREREDLTEEDEEKEALIYQVLLLENEIANLRRGGREDDTEMNKRGVRENCDESEALYSALDIDAFLVRISNSR